MNAPGMFLIAGNDDWTNWYYGLIPFAVFLLVTIVLVLKGVLTWADPLQGISSAAPKAAAQDVSNAADDSNKDVNLQI